MFNYVYLFLNHERGDEHPNQNTDGDGQKCGCDHGVRVVGVVHEDVAARDNSVR